MAKTSGSTRGGGSKLSESALSKALKIGEAEIRYRKTEKGIAYDKDGNILFQKSGERSSVNFSDVPDSLKVNAILTHNHPSGTNNRYGIGSSLSGTDIVFAVNKNLSQIRAVSGNYTFMITRPKGGWNVNVRELYYRQNEEIKRTSKWWDKQLRKAKKAGYFQRYNTLVHRYNATVQHSINKKLAKEFGLDYTWKKN